MRNNISHILSLVLTLTLVSSCETIELDLTQNPNNLSPSQASADFFLNSIQEDFVRQFEGDADFDANDNWSSGGVTTGDGFNELGMELTRIVNMSGRQYATVYLATTMDDEWVNAYRGILADIYAMRPLVEEAGLTRHLGISQFIEAYLLITMVDFFGDVPYSEAIQADNDLLNPVLDSGEEIYQQMLTLLDEAITNFSNTTVAEPPVDFFYGNDYDLWTKAANTLRLKILLQSRLVNDTESEFNSIIASGNYITDSTEDFIWQWGATSASQPDTRHPRYGLNYTASGAAEYMSNWMMNLMQENTDPRIRYYFYRQTNAVPGVEIDPSEELLTCSTFILPPQHYIDGGFTFCNLPNGYWGRDHGNAEGTPPDGLLRTNWGVYPVGGKFDDNSFEAIGVSSGAQGRGVTNLLTSFGVDFMRAEFAMLNSDYDTARDFMLSAFDKSIAKVQEIGARDDSADFSVAPTMVEIDNYRTNLSDQFDNTDTDGKWNILAEQYWISHFGNGVEPYNFYRRTGFPTSLQPNLEPNPGTFIRSMYYPANAVNRNSNISQKSDQSQPVFWDTNATAPIAN